MATLKYKVIKSKTQYKEYCKTLENLIATNSKSKDEKEEIELLTLLIEKWDEEHNSFTDVDPVTLLHSLMKEHNLRAKDLADMLNVGKGLVSEILNYKRGLPKGIIRELSVHFKVSQEAFNRPYKLTPNNSSRKLASA